MGSTILLLPAEFFAARCSSAATSDSATPPDAYGRRLRSLSCRTRWLSYGRPISYGSWWASESCSSFATTTAAASGYASRDASSRRENAPSQHAGGLRLWWLSWTTSSTRWSSRSASYDAAVPTADTSSGIRTKSHAHASASPRNGWSANADGGFGHT